MSTLKFVETNAINKNGLSIRLTPLINSGEKVPCNFINSAATVLIVLSKSFVFDSFESSTCSLMVYVPFK